MELVLIEMGSFMFLNKKYHLFSNKKNPPALINFEDQFNKS